MTKRRVTRNGCSTIWRSSASTQASCARYEPIDALLGTQRLQLLGCRSTPSMLRAGHGVRARGHRLRLRRPDSPRRSRNRCCSRATAASPSSARTPRWTRNTWRNCDCILNTDRRRRRQGGHRRIDDVQLSAVHAGARSDMNATSRGSAERAERGRTSISGWNGTPELRGADACASASSRSSATASRPWRSCSRCSTTSRANPGLVRHFVMASDVPRRLQLRRRSVAVRAARSRA